MNKILLLIFTLSISLFPAEPLCVYREMEGDWKFINSDGEVFKTRSDIVQYGGYREDRHRVILDIDGEELWAFLDSSGELLFTLDYDNVKDYYNGVALVSEEIRDPNFPRIYGYIDKDGNEVVEPKYKDALVFQEGLAYVMNDEERGYINTEGKFEIILADTIVGYRFSEGKAAVSDPEFKHSLINKKGELLSEFIYDEPSFFSEGLARANYNGEVGLIDTSGNILIPFEYYEIMEFSEGMSFASKPTNGMEHIWALIDKDGNILSEHVYEFVSPFSQGLAAVKHKELGWMYITKDNSEYLDMSFRYINNFSGEEELAWASKLINFDYFESGFIDKTGDFIVEIENYVFAFDLRLNQRVY